MMNSTETQHVIGTAQVWGSVALISCVTCGRSIRIEYAPDSAPSREELADEIRAIAALHVQEKSGGMGSSS